MPLTTPQSQLFDVGGALTLKALFGLGPYVDVGPTVGFVGLPASSSNSLSSDAGVGWQIGGGFRFKRPHDAGRGLAAVSPWVDTDALYVRTGPLDRFGFTVGTGFAFPIGHERRYWLGPFVRYFQIVQPIRQDFNNDDAKIVIVGVSLEAGSAHKPHVQRHPVETVAVRCPPTVECPPIARLSDRDGDGVPDMFDRCPEVVGPIDNQGCPLYEKVVVKDDKLELKEKIQFAWDSAVIEPVSHSVLDEVVKALKDNKSFNVRIEGHASSEGPDEHNQTLSEKRAEAVGAKWRGHHAEQRRHRPELQMKLATTTEPIGRAMEATRENYRHKMETQMKEWGARLDGQNAQIEKAAAEAKAELKRQVEELHKLQESAKKHFDQFVASSSDQWKDAKAGLEETWTKLSTAVEAAWKKVVSA